MFHLFEVTDGVEVPPRDFGLAPAAAIARAVDRKYSDRLIRGHGLCLCMWDIVSVGDGHVHPGSGSSTSRATFRLLMLRPEAGEVLAGTITRSSPNGLFVSLGRFLPHAVEIPGHALQEGSRFVPSKPEDLPAQALEDPKNDPTGGGNWVWAFDGQEFPYWIGERVLFRVESVQEFGRNEAVGPAAAAAERAGAIRRAALGDRAGDLAHSSTLPRVAFEGAPRLIIRGSMDGTGLGAVGWWSEAAAGAIEDGSGSIVLPGGAMMVEFAQEQQRLMAEREQRELAGGAGDDAEGDGDDPAGAVAAAAAAE